MIGRVASLTMLLTGCVSPPSVSAPTRPARAGTIAGGLALQYAAMIGTADRKDDRGEIRTAPSLHDPWLPRPQAWASYSVHDSLSFSFSTTVPITAASLQLGAQWAPLRTRYLDLAALVRGGSELCIEPLNAFSEFGHCQGTLGAGQPLYAQGSALALIGINPHRSLAVQLQAGAWARKGNEWRSGAWLGGNALVIVSDALAVGPDVAILPGWFEDGRMLVQPSLSFVFWPQKNSNPYR